MALKQIPITLSQLDTAGANLYEQTLPHDDGVMYHVQIDAWMSNDYRKATDAELEALRYLRSLEAMKG